MIVATWTQKRLQEKMLKEAADVPQEEEELAQHIFAIGMEQYHDDDFDPFGFNMLDDDNQQIIHHQAGEPGCQDNSTANNDTHNHQHNFNDGDDYPGYAWTNIQEEVDTTVTTKMRPLDEILSKHKHDRFQVPLLQRQQPDTNQRGINYHSAGSSPIDYDMWEPLAEWIEELKWSTSSADNGNFKDKYSRSVTCCEITMAFQYQTGYIVKSKTTPLATQLACVKAAF